MIEEQREILRNAFAAMRRGEITAEQYQDVRRMIADEMLRKTAEAL